MLNNAFVTVRKLLQQPLHIYTHELQFFIFFLHSLHSLLKPTDLFRFEDNHSSKTTDLLQSLKTTELNMENTNVFDLITRPTATILVGADEVVFHIPKALLCATSPFFKAALDGNFQEKDTQLLKLPEEDPRIFAIINRWMYCKELKHVLDRHLDETGIEGNRNWKLEKIHLACLIHTASIRLSIPDLPEEAVEAIDSVFSVSLGFMVEPRTICALWTKARRSILRKMCNGFRKQHGIAVDKFQECFDTLPGFSEAIVRQVFGDKVEDWAYLDVVDWEDYGEVKYLIDRKWSDENTFR